MKRVLAWLAVPCLIVAVLVGWFGYQIANNWLAARDARAALHEAIPRDATVVDEKVYPCDTDDDAVPPYCGTSYVVLPGEAGPQWAEAIRNQLLAHNYQLVGDSYTANQRWDIVAVRGNDRIYATVPDATGRKTCFKNIASQATTWHTDPRRDAWECAASLNYSRLSHPKTHL